MCQTAACLGTIGESVWQGPHRSLLGDYWSVALARAPMQAGHYKHGAYLSKGRSRQHPGKIRPILQEGASHAGIFHLPDALSSPREKVRMQAGTLGWCLGQGRKGREALHWTYTAHRVVL